jgi:N-glycosylase/DNA lyase
MKFELEIAPLDLGQTLGCGQTFRWRPQPDGSWLGPLGDQMVTLRSRGRRVEAEMLPGRRGSREIVARHLRAGDDIPAIQRSLSKDPVLARGMRGMRGLRIVKTDEWECLISFMLATYANIPRISKMIETISTRFGERITDDSSAFPNIDRLRKVPEDELRRCGLGYRAEYVHAVCEELDETDLARMKRLGSEQLRRELKSLPGVGDKVADCVSLFGFGRLEAFPIDVWMERALRRLYGQKGSYESLRRFAADRFGPYAGYAQEYLYLNERRYASSGACGFSKKRE